MSQATQYCPHCGKQITLGVLWCPFCGKDPRNVLVLDVPSAPQKPPNRLHRILSLWNQGLGGKVVFLLIFSCCLCLPVCAVITNLTDDPPAVTELATEEAPTSHPVTDTPTETTLPTITTAPTAAPRVPGLSPIDVTLNLEDRDFTCSEPERGDLYFTRFCRLEEPLYTFEVGVYGRELFTVDLIEAIALQFTSAPSDDIAAPFLGFVATMPYDGSSPLDARTWVEENIYALTEAGNELTAEFGDVQYRLSGIPTSRILEIGALLIEDDPELMATLNAESSQLTIPITNTPLTFVTSTQAAISQSPTPTATATSTPAPSPTRTVTTTNLPTVLPPPTSTLAPSGPVCDCVSDTYNCGDFPLPNGTTSDQCFQYCLSQGAGDIHRLDGDNDGDACEQGN
jgi:hypothetical protein